MEGENVIVNGRRVRYFRNNHVLCGTLTSVYRTKCSGWRGYASMKRHTYKHVKIEQTAVYKVIKNNRAMKNCCNKKVKINDKIKTFFLENFISNISTRRVTDFGYRHTGDFDHFIAHNMRKIFSNDRSKIYFNEFMFMTHYCNFDPEVHHKFLNCDKYIITRFEKIQNHKYNKNPFTREPLDFEIKNSYRIAYNLDSCFMKESLLNSLISELSDETHYRFLFNLDFYKNKNVHDYHANIEQIEKELFKSFSINQKKTKYQLCVVKKHDKIEVDSVKSGKYFIICEDYIFNNKFYKKLKSDFYVKFGEHYLHVKKEYLNINIDIRIKINNILKKIKTLVNFNFFNNEYTIIKRKNNDIGGKKYRGFYKSFIENCDKTFICKKNSDNQDFQKMSNFLSKDVGYRNLLEIILKVFFIDNFTSEYNELQPIMKEYFEIINNKSIFPFKYLVTLKNKIRFEKVKTYYAAYIFCKDKIESFEYKFNKTYRRNFKFYC